MESKVSGQLWGCWFPVRVLLKTAWFSRKTGWHGKGNLCEEMGADSEAKQPQLCSGLNLLGYRHGGNKWLSLSRDLVTWRCLAT